jgi:Ni/Co efflux regulator RcnB
MRKIALKTSYTLACLIAGMLAAGPVLADKPAWAGNGKKQEKNDTRRDARDRDQGQDRDRDRQARTSGGHFDDARRGVVREYYGEQFRTGRCPPGLAKKNNGCMPPGQAKKWRVGRPLPRDVIFYDLPPTLVVQLGRPPAGHRYVRVAADILLIAVGTGMVIDAIQDLDRM